MQAWALKTILERMGHEVYFFIHKRKPVHSLIIMPLVWIKRTINYVLGYSKVPIFIEIKDIIRRKRGYGEIQKFIRKNFNFHSIYDVTDVPKGKYDLIIVGSDQIWRKKYIEYLWAFTDIADAFLYNCKSEVKRISYGASFGVDVWEFDNLETQRIKRALNCFSAISVRENSAISLLKDIAAVDADWVLDPTMLIKKEEYISIFDIRNTEECVGIVSYLLDSNSEKKEIIDTLKNNKKIPVMELNCTPALPMAKWIKGFAKADIVVTDSFHGCVFSIIFGKPLIFIPNIERGNARFDTLICKLGITHNIVNKENPFDISSDYSLPNGIQDRLNLYRKESLNFLIKALKRI